jgi:hypothetical protein
MKSSRTGSFSVATSGNQGAKWPDLKLSRSGLFFRDPVKSHSARAWESYDANS